MCFPLVIGSKRRQRGFEPLERKRRQVLHRTASGPRRRLHRSGPHRRRHPGPHRPRPGLHPQPGLRQAGQRHREPRGHRRFEEVELQPRQRLGNQERDRHLYAVVRHQRDGEHLDQHNGAEEHVVLQRDAAGDGSGPEVRLRGQRMAERSLRAHVGRLQGGAHGVSLLVALQIARVSRPFGTASQSTGGTSWYVLPPTFKAEQIKTSFCFRC